MSFLVEIPLETYRDDAFRHFKTSDTFDIGTARALMWLSQLAYEVRDARHKVTPVLQRWDLQRCALVSKEDISARPLTSTHGIVAQGRDVTFVSFAGTDPLALGNWITNFTLGPNTREMHHGFRGALDAVWNELCAALKAADPQAPIYFSGHSLGGALAVTAAERVQRELNLKAAGVYTFGAPRVGNASFAENYIASGLGARTYRLIHGLDIIPTVPPARLGFHHAGHMMTCERGAGFMATAALSEMDNNDPPFTQTMWNSYRQRWQDVLGRNFPATSRKGWLGWYQRYMLPPTIADHLPERYRQAFEQSVQAAE